MSRYIHLNPVETKIPLVEQLEDYTWSSYCAYVSQQENPVWLQLDLTRHLLRSANDLVLAYRQFVMQGSDEKTVSFHKNGKMGAVFGDESFKSWVFENLLPQLKSEKICQEKWLSICVSLFVSRNYWSNLKGDSRSF